MKNVLIVIILIVSASYLSFKCAYWLGSEKTRIELESLYMPLQNTPVVDKATYYDKYLLKNCLLENSALKGN